MYTYLENYVDLTSLGRHDFFLVYNSLCSSPYHLTFVRSQWDTIGWIGHPQSICYKCKYHSRYSAWHYLIFYNDTVRCVAWYYTSLCTGSSSWLGSYYIRCHDCYSTKIMQFRQIGLPVVNARPSFYDFVNALSYVWTGSHVLALTDIFAFDLDAFQKPMSGSSIFPMRISRKFKHVEFRCLSAYKTLPFLGTNVLSVFLFLPVNVYDLPMVMCP